MFNEISFEYDITIVTPDNFAELLEAAESNPIAKLCLKLLTEEIEHIARSAKGKRPIPCMCPDCKNVFTRMPPLFAVLLPSLPSAAPQVDDDGMALGLCQDCVKRGDPRKTITSAIQALLEQFIGSRGQTLH